MSTANRVRLSSVVETTAGTTPNTPRMRLVRINDERLTFAPQYIDSNELRSDRMTADPIKVQQAAGGSYTLEWSYPDADSPESTDLESTFYANWVNTPTFFNDGTADSVITDAGTTTDTYAVVSGGASVVAGHLVQASGFTNAANNQIFRVASSSATTIVGSSLSLTAEAAPPAAAKLKVVGFRGASGDVTATTTGLASTALNFTTLGLAVGMKVKIGGTADATTFAFLVSAGATARANAWGRITAIAATALTLDNLPVGWTTDAGTSKTISVWFGDHIKNGVTQITMTKEIGFMDQTVPTYITNVGMTVNTNDISVTARQVITSTIAWTGQGGGQSTTSLDASPDAATTGRVMAAHANVGRIGENGVTLIAPNWARALTFQINNNQRTIEDIGSTSPVAVNPGECTVTGRIETYFGDNVMLQKLYVGTPTSISSRWQKDSQATIWDFPRVTFRGGDPQVTGKNTDVVLPLDFKAALDPLTSAHVLLDRIIYYEA